ncbi:MULTISPECIES: ABC transporter permease [unclassified Beijerinckia]|uniref:ABC transporter permease n=1 Tax=unclassified Beijerinckia TaxID=2638183 RepID=UPI000896EF8F|nr:MULTISPECIES: ABC transporter permease [unclassified Beijerinckia]MDH7799459.1 putative ABC transport system permease protein [Beijerinckia sp. GAS462]SED51192.1 putative ABC transport system permease protein [Beijerinckia sp. 28-YEA-48]
MLAELTNISPSVIILGLEQTAAAIAICAVVVFLCLRVGVDVRREAVLSAARGFCQMVAVGALLVLLLHGSLLIGACILFAMVIAAAVTASRRGKGAQGAFLTCVYAIGAGAGVVLVVMLLTKALSTDVAVLVPVGSMIIANAMNSCAQAMERLRADVTSHVGEIEAALSLGATPAVAVRPYVNNAVYASLLPRLDMLKSLGLVWIPGVMAGMMVSGANPIYAGIYQFVIVAMILAASGMTGLIATVLSRRAAFSVADQLLLRRA